MNKKLICLFFALALMTGLCACGWGAGASDPAGRGADEGSSGAEVKRADGERFETVIVVEGMEETVQYKHVVSDTVGFEMDYDYERFTRHGGWRSERFVSIYEEAEYPEDYFEVTYSDKDADAVTAAIVAELSKEYDVVKERVTLDRAGDCVLIDASEAKDGGGTPERLQAVYVIPAEDGCRVAAAHYAVEGAEGFGRRFTYLAHTLEVVERSGEGLISNEEALTAIRKYCFAQNPALEEVIEAGRYPIYWFVSESDEREVVVTFRAYTGALVGYHIDRATGQTYVTETVPRVSAEERTDEVLNVKDYLA